MFSKTENQKVHFLYEFHIKKAHLPNRRVIDDLYSPHNFSHLQWLAGKSLFPLFIYYYDYVTKMFTLLSFSVSSRQLCFVCNQSKRKKTRKNFVILGPKSPHKGLWDCLGTRVKTNMKECSVESSDDNKVSTQQNSNKVEVIERSKSKSIKPRKEDAHGTILP